MPMRATTVRFDESLWSMLEREAREQGVSAAQFVRDAAILRVAAVAAQRGDEELKLTVEDVASGALRNGGSRPAGAPVPPAVLDAGRIAAVHATGLLTGRPDPAFDRLTRLAAKMLGTTGALVSLVDRDRQVFAGCAGVGEPWLGKGGTPLSHSICQHAVQSREPLLVSDARDHPLLRDNGAVTELGVIAYAGIPLIDDAGHALGSLCVFDSRPRSWTPDDVATLEDLAASAMSEIRLRAVAAA